MEGCIHQKYLSGRHKLGWFVLILLLCVSFISLDHLFGFALFSELSVFHLGCFGWFVFSLTLLFLSRKFLFSAISVFFIFALFAFLTGPFLEPPADSLDHLRRTQTICGEDSSVVSTFNGGLWHYSMNSIFVCSEESERKSPDTIVAKIDVLHGMYCGILALALFILSQSAGLPVRWGFFSVMCCFLFFGTNKFSYFSYYSLGPTFTSMAIYWLWAAVFFFRKKVADVFLGLLAGVILLPILWVNHYQEAAFLGIIILLHFLINMGKYIWFLDTDKGKWLKVVFAMLVLSLLVLPQFVGLRGMLDGFIPWNYWDRNANSHTVTIAGLYLVGKFWAVHRVNDTLGIAGYAPLLLAVLSFIPGLIIQPKENYKRVVVLGLLPFVGFGIPLVHFFWVAGVKAAVYYRLCYTSMFWLLIAYFFYLQEERIAALKEGCYNTALKNLYFVLCLVAMLILSGIRSGPVYGKLEFMLVDSKSWWREWRPMIVSVLNTENKQPVYSDYMTSSILFDVFGVSVNSEIKHLLTEMHYPLISVENMAKEAANNKYECLINLHGFDPTWVPAETRHWSPGLADTSRYYEFQGKRGIELREYLQKYPERNCKIFY